MKNTLLAKYIEFLLYTSFGNGYGIVAIILPILIFGLTFIATGFIAIIFIVGFIFYLLIYKADKIKDFFDL